MNRSYCCQCVGLGAYLLLGLAACSSSDGEHGAQGPALDPAGNGFPAELERACANESDLAGFSADIDGLDVQGHATACGLQCLGSADSSCNQTCLHERVGDVLSADCTACAVGVVACITENCFSDCLDPGSEVCGRCACDRERGGCRELFSRCTGFPNGACG